MVPDRPVTSADGRHLVLVGLMGSGKSTVGAILARHLGRTFVDLDEEVAAREGQSVRDLLASGAGAAFREAEAAALADLLAATEPTVIATGGGAVLDPGSRRLLNEGPVVVWLQAPTTVLVARVAHEGAPDRPLLDEGPETVLDRLADERTPLYAEVADLSIDSATDDPDGVAASVLAGLLDSALGWGGRSGQPVDGAGDPPEGIEGGVLGDDVLGSDVLAGEVAP